MKETNEYNKFYLNEDRRGEPKEYYKFLLEKSSDELNHKHDADILDIGCATGEFIYFLKDKYPLAKYTGMDVLDELLENAKVNVPGANFISADIMDITTLPGKKYDVIFMSGVVYLFDTYETWVNNVLHLLKPGGAAYIFGAFNPEPLDMQISVTPASENLKCRGKINIFSVTTIRNYLEGAGVPHEFMNWSISIPLEKKEGDPMRSWTIKDEEGNYLIVNGLQLINTFYLLKIRNR